MLAIMSALALGLVLVVGAVIFLDLNYVKIALTLFVLVLVCAGTACYLIASAYGLLN